MNIQRIGIIGAGISGLVAAKTFIQEGYKVTVFEKQKGLGGVWEKSRTYPGMTVQSPRDTYAFSDYPMPASYPEWPTAEQIRNYLESYAHQFGVFEHIRFQAEVIKVKKNIQTPTGWLVSFNYKDDSDSKVQQEEQEFDFVLICNGIFSIPKVPNLPGKEDFIASGGQVMHSTDFQNSCVLEGKQVIVVGFGKSATDIATLTVSVASECTLVFRQIPWKVPRFFLGLVNIKYILLTPFAEAWLPYLKLKGIERFLHTVGKPMVWAFWRINEMLLRLQFGLDACRMLPDKPLNKWVISTIGLESKGLYQYIRSGKIRTRKTQIKGFFPNGVELDNGERLQAEVVIFATGFQQDLSFLEDKYRQLVIDDLNNFYLYRNLIHPDIPQLGFVGYNSSKFCPLTSDISAQWLVEYVKGNLVLPPRQKMLEEMKAEWHWKQREWESGLVNGASVFPFSFHYLDELINDIGVRSYKKGWKRIKEIMMPIDPSAYKNLRQELLPKRYP